MNLVANRNLRAAEVSAEQKPSTFAKWEYVIPALAVVSFIVSCVIVSSKRYFWIDELFTYLLIGDRSFRHMLIAFGDKFTNVPPLYFVLGWVWARAFGVTELSLRLFSALGMSVACVVTWITLRRNYEFWPTVIGTLGAFCLTDIVLAQNAEARMYGLFLAVCSLGVLEFDVINRHQYCSTVTLLVNALIHAAIVQTHLFGIIYSGAILCAFLIRDRVFNVFRPRVYLSVVLGWLSLIPYIPTFLNQADGGNPRTWIPVPDLDKLILVLVPSASTVLSLVIIVALLISTIRFVFKTITSRDERLPQKQTSSATELSLRILAFLFLAVPLCVWIVSRTIKPLFVPKYMIPISLAWAILLAYLASKMIERGRSLLTKPLGFKLTSVALGALAIILLIHPITYARSLLNESFPGINDSKFEYRHLPIVTTHSHDFVKRFHYSPERNRYFFALDWEAAVDVRSGLFGPQEYKTMDALKRDYPDIFGDHILQLSDFLVQHDRFLVLADMYYRPRWSAQDFHRPRWLETRIENNPGFKTRTLGMVDGRRLLLVEKVVAGGDDSGGTEARP
jgi:hypothetical protein